MSKIRKLAIYVYENEAVADIVMIADMDALEDTVTVVMAVTDAVVMDMLRFTNTRDMEVVGMVDMVDMDMVIDSSAALFCLPMNAVYF